MSDAPAPETTTDAPAPAPEPTPEITTDAPAPAPAPEPAPETTDAPAPAPEPAPAPAPAPEPAPAPPVLLLSEVLSAQELVQQKEAADKAALEYIGNVSNDVLRARLIQWISQGYPPAFTLFSISVTPPEVCSDGQTRALAEYIRYCSGKLIHEHVAALQARLPDIVVSFAYTGADIPVVISKV